MCKYVLHVYIYIHVCVHNKLGLRQPSSELNHLIQKWGTWNWGSWWKHTNILFNNSNRDTDTKEQKSEVHQRVCRLNMAYQEQMMLAQTQWGSNLYIYICVSPDEAGWKNQQFVEDLHRQMLIFDRQVGFSCELDSWYSQAGSNHYLTLTSPAVEVSEP